MNRVVVLYTKPGCHLCEAVEQVIRRVAGRRAFELVLRNIEANPAEFERFKDDIPVVTVDGVEVARHRMTAEQLERALK